MDAVMELLLSFANKVKKQLNVSEHSRNVAMKQANGASGSDKFSWPELGAAAQHVYD